MAKKKQKKEKKTNQVYKVYDTSGELKRNNSFCPKCGQGVFMAKHKDRVNCGKCGYTEFIKSDAKSE